MNSQQRNFSEDSQIIRRRRRSRLNADELLLNIPIDLIIEIFSRLQVKSIARCRCVSKRWASVLRSPDFIELFVRKSLARPKLLFACLKKSEVVFFSSPQPQNPDENMSSIAANHHMSFPVGPCYDISTHVNGYVCLSYDRMKGMKSIEIVVLICNPSTGQSFTLPGLKTMNRSAKSFLGYDPIDKQHKVMVWQHGVEKHQVLTLRGIGKLTWRLIECSIPHFSPGKSVCINGVLYYTAEAFNGDDKKIVCFDCRYEKYSFVKLMEKEIFLTTLINFQGKLATVRSYYLNKTSKSFEMWFLEDPEKHEWSKRVFNLPPTWKDVVGYDVLFFKGVTATNEIVLSPSFKSNRVYSYNFVKETITRVEIQGLGALERRSRGLTSINHVEDLKLM